GETGAGTGSVPPGGRVRGHGTEMIFFFILLVLLVVAQIAEFFIPTVDWMYHAHIYIVPVIVFYGAMALPFPLMLALALFAGILLDALTVQVIGAKVEISMGWSILLYAVLAGIMHGMRPLFIRGRLSPRLRIQVLGVLMLLGMGVLGFRLWWVQVAHGAEWTAQIRGSSQATVRIPSVRGEIKDRNGLTLVQNRASYEVDFYLPEMVKGFRERFGPPPLAEHRAIISGMPKDVKEPDIIKIVNDGIVPRLNDLDLARDYNSTQLERHYRNDTEVPYSYIKDIDFPTMAKFSEHDVGLPGVDIAIKPVRSYVYGALASHLLGYVGAPDDTNKEEAKKFTFYQGDVDGKS